MFFLWACTPDVPPAPLDTGEPPPAPVVVADLALAMDASVATIIVATWTDPGVDEVWVEYRFEGEEWLVAPAIAPGRAALLGIPGDTAVEARLGGTNGRGVVESPVVVGATGSVPVEVPLPTIDAWDTTTAMDADYVMISVAGGEYTFSPPYWIEIFDRAGRIVWYHSVDNGLFSFYPTVARDGTHIWYDASDVFGIADAPPKLVRRTLDGRWSTEVAVPGMGQAAAEGPDGSFYFERRSEVVGLGRVDPDGTITTVWNCTEWMRSQGVNDYACYINTCNWSAERDTILASSFTADTVFEVQVATGEVVRQMGQLQTGAPYTFDPPESVFAYQHGPYWTDAGTLLVSTHLDGVDGTQIAAEYAVDDATQTLTRVWDYTSTDLWATQLGEAIRLPNGNTLLGYGQDGAVREVTPEGAVAWQVSWPRDLQGYRVIGHASLITDLYALNVGP